VLNGFSLNSKSSKNKGRKSERFNVFGLAAILALVICPVSALFYAPVASAHAGYDHSNPPANSKLPGGQMPKQVQVWFAEAIEPRFSELGVVDKNGVKVDAGDSRVPSNDPKSLLVSLKPGLPDGPYTIIYKNTSAEDGHALNGSFVFVVGVGELPVGTGTSPLELAERSGSVGADSNANPWSISLRWLNYLGSAALFGGLVYALLVWRSAVHRAKATGKIGPQLETAYALGLNRIRRIIWFGFGGLLLGWLGWFLYQAATFSSQNIGQLFGVGVATNGSGARALSDFLFGSRYGQIWLARLGLLLLAMLVWVVATTTHRFISQTNPAELKLPNAKRLRQNLLPADGTNGGFVASGETAPSSPAAVRNWQVTMFESRQSWWWAVALLGAALLLTSSLNSHAAGIQNWTWFAIGSDWLHLLSTTCWVGGLFAMVWSVAIAIPALLPGSGDRTRLLSALIPAFSQIAIINVTTLLVTGMIGAVVELSDVTELFSSPYGLSLGVKILLLVPLLMLAVYNLRVVSPRMRAFARSKKAGPKEGAGSIAAGALGASFRRGVLAEAGLISLVLLAAAFLTSYAPAKNTAASNQVFYYQTERGNVKIALAISPAIVGENTFEVRLVDKTSDQPISDATLVDLRLNHLDMQMGQPQLELKPTSQGHYLGQGPILSMAGNWETNLLIQRPGQDDLKIPVTFKVK
jgi:copper transport protein